MLLMWHYYQKPYCRTPHITIRSTAAKHILLLSKTVLLLVHAAGEQQFVQQVAPTFIQLLTLQYTAEQLVREETGKLQLAS